METDRRLLGSDDASGVFRWGAAMGGRGRIIGRVWFVGSERTCIVGCRVGAFGWPEERRSLAGRMQEVPSGLARGKRPNRPFLLGQARSVQLFTRLMMY